MTKPWIVTWDGDDAYESNLKAFEDEPTAREYAEKRATRMPNQSIYIMTVVGSCVSTPPVTWSK